MIEDLCSNGCAGFNPKDTGTSTTGSAALYQSIPNPTSGPTVIGYSINMPFSVASIQVSDNGGKAIRQFTPVWRRNAG